MKASEEARMIAETIPMSAEERVKAYDQIVAGLRSRERRGEAAMREQAADYLAGFVPGTSPLVLSEYIRAIPLSGDE